MISRGYYLGEIIDELSAIGAQVKMRNAVGLTDLTVYAENFFRDILNIVLKANFVNLNANRSNEPGLDLGDEKLGMGVQVTSSAGVAKINSTLAKITSQQLEKYPIIVVLIIGKRQRKYTLPELAQQTDFSLKNIWDLDSLARKALDLEIDDLQALHRTVRSEVARLKVELELPDEEGNYPTSGFDHWEVRVKPKIGDGGGFVRFYQKEHGQVLNKKEKNAIIESIGKLGQDLSNLPRVTREFFAMLYERRDISPSRRFKDGWVHLLYAKAEREYRGRDLKGELGILEHAGFLEINGEDPYEFGAPEIGVIISRDCDELAGAFVDFMKLKQLSYRKVIGEADLSAF